MKRLILLAITVMITSPAFAIRVYHGEECVSTTHKMVFTGSYRVGGAFDLGKLNAKSNEIVDVFESNTRASSHVNTIDVERISQLSYKVIPTLCGKGEAYSYSETESESIVEVTFTKLKAEDEALTGIKTGDTMVFQCKQTYSSPIRCSGN